MYTTLSSLPSRLYANLPGVESIKTSSASLYGTITDVALPSIAKSVETLGNHKLKTLATAVTGMALLTAYRAVRLLGDSLLFLHRYPFASFGPLPVVAIQSKHSSQVAKMSESSSSEKMPTSVASSLSSPYKPNHLLPWT